MGIRCYNLITARGNPVTAEIITFRLSQLSRFDRVSAPRIARCRVVGPLASLRPDRRGVPPQSPSAPSYN
jgi:hypothetical protein